MKNLVKKPLVLLLFLAPIYGWGASKPRPCPLVIQNADDSYGNELETSLRTFSTVPLIRQLQKRTVIRDRDLGRVLWSAFDPRWMFNDEVGIGLLIDGHSEGYQMSPVTVRRPQGSTPRRRPQVLPQYEGIAAFVDRWEADVVRKGGPVSAAWTTASYSPVDKKQLTGRQRFIKRLMLELAYAYQLQNGVVPGEQPVHFTQTELDVNWSLLPSYAETVLFFGEVEAFQTQYRDFARARLGVRTPYMRWRGMEVQRTANRVLRAQGQAPISSAGAIRAEDRDQRERREMVESGARLIVDSGDKQFPLAAIANSESGIGDSVHAGALLPNLENIADHFENLDEFVAELNRLLAPRDIVLELGPGVRRWAIEWLVQLGAAQARELGYTAKRFPGFQTADPDEPHFLNAGSYLYLNAQKHAPRKGLLFVVDLNDLIRRRLP